VGRAGRCRRGSKHARSRSIINRFLRETRHLRTHLFDPALPPTNTRSALSCFSSEPGCHAHDNVQTSVFRGRCKPRRVCQALHSQLMHHSCMPRRRLLGPYMTDGRQPAIVPMRLGHDLFTKARIPVRGQLHRRSLHQAILFALYCDCKVVGQIPKIRRLGPAGIAVFWRRASQEIGLTRNRIVQLAWSCVTSF